MKVRAGAVAALSFLLFSGLASAQAALGSSVRSAGNVGEIVHVALTGRVYEGEFHDPDTSKPIPYLYLELDKPVGSYVNNLEPSERGYRDIELVGGTAKIIYRLEALAGQRVTVRGELPFTFVANAPSRVLPVIMLMDQSNPQLFK